MEEVFLHKPIVQHIISFLTPWDRTQNAPLVCKTWAMIVRDPATHQTRPLPDSFTRRAVWLMWKYMLEENGSLVARLLPSCLPVRKRPENDDIWIYIIGDYEIHGNNLWVEHLLCNIVGDTHESMIVEILDNVEKTFGRDHWLITGIMWKTRFVCIYMLIQYILHTFDPKFWSEFINLNDQSSTPEKIGMIYYRLICVLEFRYGITDINIGPKVEIELNKVGLWFD